MHVSGIFHSGTHVVGQSIGIASLVTSMEHYSITLLSLSRMWVPGAPSPGTVVDLADGSHVEGTVVQLWGSNDTVAQFWLFQDVSPPSV